MENNSRMEDKIRIDRQCQSLCALQGLAYQHALLLMFPQHFAALVDALAMRVQILLHDAVILCMHLLNHLQPFALI
jgi:hypothetical protein